MTKNCRFLFFVLFFILFLDLTKGQEITKSELNPKFEDLENSIQTANNRDRAYKLSKELILITKTDGKETDLLFGYLHASNFAPDSLALKYSDSALNVAIKLKDQTAIGSSYITIAGRSLRIFDYKKATEYSIISYDYYKTQNSIDMAKMSLLTIAKVNSLIRNDNHAMTLANESYLHFKMKPPTPNNKFWLNISRIYLIYLNSNLKKYRENKFLIDEAYEFFHTNKEFIFYKFHIFFVDGRNDYYLGKYSFALSKLENAKKAIDLVDSQNLDNIDFYIAMCYWKMGNIEKSFPIFENIKKNFLKTKKTSLEFRPAFDFFTEYYKKHGTTQQQLTSLNDLLEFDKFEKDVKNYVQIKLKDFDDKHKTEEQALSEDEQKFSDWLSIAIISLSSIGVAYFVYRKIKANKKKDVLKVVEIQKTPTEIPQPKNNKEEIKQFSNGAVIDYSLYRPINKLTVDQILVSMKNFESSFGFLEKDLKLTTLAKKMNTNEKYLSKVIKIYKGKTFNSYLTDLRFEYLDEKLKTDSQFRNQRIKDISSKLGFGSPEFFATAFKEKYGKSPKEFFGLN